MQQCEKLPIVKRYLTIRYLLAALATAGLLLSPFGRPVAAMSMEMPATMGDHAAMGMAEGMPCCPDIDKKTDCAKDCRCMAACIGKIFPIAQGRGPVSSLLGLASLIIPRDDAMPGGLAQAPPPRPPRA